MNQNRVTNKKLCLLQFYLLVHFLERWLAYEHEVDAASSAPQVDTFTVHLCALDDFRGSVNRSTDPRWEHPEATARSSVHSRVWSGSFIDWWLHQFRHAQTLLIARACSQWARLPDLWTAKVAHLLPHFVLCYVCSQISAPSPDTVGAVIELEHAWMVEVDYL